MYICKYGNYKTTIFDDRGFIKINGEEQASFLSKTLSLMILKIMIILHYLSIFISQANIYMNFILKFEDGYLLNAKKKIILHYFL